MADDISTWAQDGVRVFHLKGRVLLAQSPLKVSMEEAYLWVDEANQAKTGTYRLKLVAKQAELEEGSAKEAAPDAVFDFATRGKIEIKAYVSKVTAKDLSGSPSYQAALRLAESD